MKFNVGDRVVATNDDFLKAGVGTVTGAHEKEGAYGVLFDKEEHRGPFGSGAMWMYENEIKPIEEEKMMKKAVMIREPKYYTSFNEGDEITLLRRVGFNSRIGENEYLFAGKDGTEQFICEGDFRWIDEDVSTSILVGDMVRIKDVYYVVLSEQYFRNGDITEVVAELPHGGMYVKVPEKSAHSHTEMKHGIPVLYVTKEERENYFERVSQDTPAEDTYEQDTKDCRIAELEAEVAELKEQLAAAMTLLKGAL